MIVYLETLGCSRNQVDSEIMLGKLVAGGHSVTDDPSVAQVIIVNTCGFISTASDEAVDVILEMAAFKQKGKCERLIATGCLAQRYKDDAGLVTTLPEVDAFLGTAACDQIVDAVESKELKTLTLFPDPNLRPFQDPSDQRELISDGFSYIKVSEGCNRKCTYCIIPQLRGIQRSRPVDDICKEAENFVSNGTKEIILTAENTTDYGQDLKDGIGFEHVLTSLAAVLKKKEVWKGWPDFFGKPTEYHENNYLNYADASKLCQQRKLKNSIEYRTWVNRPTNLPARPDQYYKEEWSGWRSFLGNNYHIPERKVASKLKPTDVRIIKHQLDLGISGAVLARTFGVSEMQISRIKHGENWTKVE